MEKSVELKRWTTALKRILRDPALFTAQASGLNLRAYQQDVIQAVIRSVIGNQGLSFVVMFPRQSGKNELQAQMETYLLLLFSQSGAEIVKISPTWKPQTINAMNRLERVLTKNLLTRGRWTREAGYIYRLNQATCIFLSGNPEASIVGHTAGTLLEVDEAQDIEIDKYDKEIAPMAASTNATRVFYGTAWTSRTLLARELRAARAAQAVDGLQRVFVVDADRVGAEVEPYRLFVDSQLARLGRQHPMIKTQYFCEEIDAEAGLFNPQRTALMHGNHKKQTAPIPEELYCFTLDVAGQDENRTLKPGEDSGPLANPRRDSTVLTVFHVDRSTLADPALRAPTYRTVNRYSWTGTVLTTIYAQVKALVESWNPRFVVVDATGLGAGIASFLTASLGERVIPFTFTAASKSKLGYDFLAIIDSGRYREHADADPLQDTFWHELSYCLAETRDAPGHALAWSVPDGTRDPSGELVHDDFIMSAALIGMLDAQPWPAPGQPVMIRRRDILDDIDAGGF